MIEPFKALENDSMALNWRYCITEGQDTQVKIPSGATKNGGKWKFDVKYGFVLSGFLGEAVARRGKILMDHF